jgi:hypothetical protein
MTEELPQELKTLFERARGDEDPKSADRLAVGRALAARLGLPAAAGAAAALSARTAAGQGSAISTVGMTASGIAGKTGVAGAAALWLVVGAALGTGVSMATVLTTASRPPPTVSAPIATSPPAAARETRNSPPPLPPARLAFRSNTKIGQLAAEKPQPPSSKPRQPETATPENEPPRVTASALREETRALAAVQQALRDGQPENALGLLDSQERAFPNGSLQAERAAARVLALCAGHRAIAARAAAAEFLRNYPESPIANRVRQSCAK